jgi:NADPH2:quinone reductase
MRRLERRQFARRSAAMKAMVMTAAGGPEVLELREVPEPAIARPTQIKVRLRAAGVNPVDTKVRSRGLFFPGAELPAVLGCDGAGEVVAVGPQATRFRVGDAVWFCNGGLGREQGNYAEYTVLDEWLAERVPAGLGFEEAAAAPLVLITAWEALCGRCCLQEGQTVLVHAGAGGVGHVAIQLARLWGARVATTVSSVAKAAFVRALGAEEIIDYRAQDVVAAVKAWTGGRGADVVFDTVGPAVFQASIPAVAHYGRLVTILDPGPNVDWKEARLHNLNVGFVLMLTPQLFDLHDARGAQVDILRQCGEWLERRELRVEVAQTFPLAQAADAHRLIEAGHVQGKLVLTI